MQIEKCCNLGKTYTSKCLNINQGNPIETECAWVNPSEPKWAWVNPNEPEQTLGSLRDHEELRRTTNEPKWTDFAFMNTNKQHWTTVNSKVQSISLVHSVCHENSYPEIIWQDQLWPNFQFQIPFPSTHFPKWNLGHCHSKHMIPTSTTFFPTPFFRLITMHLSSFPKDKLKFLLTQAKKLEPKAG